jgi:thiosulfate/3-mercaptopyruvate sulfurtransferase
MKKSLAAVSALALLLSGCLIPGYMRQQPPPPVRGELLVSANALERTLDEPGTVVLHVGRDRQSYDAGHIPGARFVPLSSLVVEREGVPNELPPVAQLEEAFEAAGVSDDSRVVLYGDLDGLAAARAFFTLDYLGHANTALLNGGLEAWREAGHRVESAAPAVQRGSFTPRPRPEVLADAEWVKSHLNDSTVLLLDARPPAEFTGAEPGPGVTRPGHIPGARNVFWRTTIVSDENPELRSRDVLRALFKLAGATHPAEAVVEQREREREARERARLEGSRRPAATVSGPVTGTTVVTYCRTGVQASFLYFVARYLGYQTKMYDGSFADWSRRGNDFPVER